MPRINSPTEVASSTVGSVGSVAKGVGKGDIAFRLSGLMDVAGAISSAGLVSASDDDFISCCCWVASLLCNEGSLPSDAGSSAVVFANVGASDTAGCSCPIMLFVCFPRIELPCVMVESGNVCLGISGKLLEPAMNERIAFCTNHTVIFRCKW